MKRILPLVLILFLCLSFCACGEVSEISPELEEEIRQAYYRLHAAELTGFSPEQIQIDGYGVFGEAAAVRISSPAVDYPAVEISQTVGEYEFRYGLPAPEIYYGGVFFTLTQAYELGHLSENHLKLFYETYRSRNPSPYEESDVSAGDSATAADSFAEDTVILLLEGSRQYTAEDFSDVGGIALEEWTGHGEYAGDQICKLTLNTKSKEEVLEVIRRLEQRDDVFAADPAYTVPIPVERRTADETELLETINAFAGGEGPFTIEKTVPLKSVTYPEGYYYVLCDLAPHGLAVLTEDGRLMMGQFLGGDLPELEENVDYYYVGVNEFAVEKDGCLYLIGSRTPLSRGSLQSVMASEARGVLPHSGWSIRAKSFDGLPIPFAPEE